MNATAAVARNAFREAIRDRVLFSLVFFAVLMVGAAVLFSQMSFGISAESLVNFSLAAITALGVILAVFLGNQLVSKEIERRTLYTLLAHPVRRSEFLLGKFAGLAATVAVNCGLMGVALLLALAYVLPGHWAAGEAAVIAALYLILLALAVLTALALLFSCFASPVMAALFSLALFVIGNFDQNLRQLGRTAHSWLGGHAAIAVAAVLPNFGAFNVAAAAAHFQTIAWRLIGLDTAYAAIYSAAALVIAGAIFAHRDLK
ncbi:MAG: ABC transporter permease [Terriglobales bacterium]